MFKPTFLHKIMPGPIVGVRLESHAQAADTAGYSMFLFNGSVYSTSLYFKLRNEGETKVHGAVIFKFSDLLTVSID